jgi:hypothetical protein
LPFLPTTLVTRARAERPVLEGSESSLPSSDDEVSFPDLPLPLEDDPEPDDDDDESDLSPPEDDPEAPEDDEEDPLPEEEFPDEEPFLPPELLLLPELLPLLLPELELPEDPLEPLEPLLLPPLFLGSQVDALYFGTQPSSLSASLPISSPVSKEHFISVEVKPLIYSPNGLKKWLRSPTAIEIITTNKSIYSTVPWPFDPK